MPTHGSSRVDRSLQTHRSVQSLGKSQAINSRQTFESISSLGTSQHLIARRHVTNGFGYMHNRQTSCTTFSRTWKTIKQKCICCSCQSQLAKRHITRQISNRACPEGDDDGHKWMTSKHIQTYHSKGKGNDARQGNM